jgi:hypothetical protein
MCQGLIRMDLNEYSVYPIKSMMKSAILYAILIPSLEIPWILETIAPSPLMQKKTQ